MSKIILTGRKTQINKTRKCICETLCPNHMLAPKDNRGIIKSLWNLSKRWLGHLHIGHNLYVWCHYLSSSSSPVILLTMLLYHTICQSRTREVIQSNIYRLFPKVNQVIYTLDTNCMPNVMILAQAVIHIVWSQGPLWVKWLSLKRGIIQSNIYRILRNVNEIIYIIYPTVCS